MLNEVKQDATVRMHKSIESLTHELSKIRTGRAHPALLDQVHVNYYGNNTPIRQIANISVEDGRTLIVTPWDRSQTAAVEKAIINSGLGLNPNTAGNVIRVPMPPLTEERRRDLIKLVRHEAEHARVTIRGVRREANHNLKELVKDKLISEDDERRGNEAIQKLTDQNIQEVDGILQDKEKDLLAI